MPGSLEKKISYKFSTPALLETALTHASVQDTAYDYERLEFLGDRVLGLVVADLLYTCFSEEREGGLAKRHAALVQRKALLKVAQQLQLADHLKLSPSEKKSGGHTKEKILADAMEALIGAIYRDGGFLAASTFIKTFWSDMLHQHVSPPEDAKSRLQEWVQARSLPLPEYTLVDKSGTDHSPQFEIEVFVKGIGRASSVAASKRAAEKSAALKILRKMGLEE
ncbi:MAG: ribonuclease III [Proteobacteria bacterium]|nr:ribonuclease III [Pseudomonadota bacterium]